LLAFLVVRTAFLISCGTFDTHEYAVLIELESLPYDGLGVFGGVIGKKTASKVRQETALPASSRK
jgi:hypothetical protein